MTNRADTEMRVRCIVSNLIYSPPALCDGSPSQTQDRERKAVRDLMELLTEPADNFTCAVPIARQIEDVAGVRRYMHRLIQFPEIVRSLDAAIKSLKWLECHLQGREDSRGECVDESGARL